MISIVTPTYNEGAKLHRALRSLQLQTFEDWECIVVDDGSTEGRRPAAVVDSLDDERFRLVEFAENRGRPKARQAGLDAARGDYLGMLDADDWYVPWKLEWQRQVARAHPACAVVAGDMYIADHRGSLRAVSESRIDGDERGRRPPTDVGEIPVRVRRWRRWGRPPFSHGSALLRMEDARSSRYDPGLSRTEDMDFLLKTALGERVARVEAPLYVYTLPRPDERAGRMFEALRNELRVCLGHLPRYPVRAGENGLRVLAKMVAYELVFALDVDPSSVRRAHREPTPEERDQFAELRRRLDSGL